MEMHNMPRQTGKTTRAIERWKEHPDNILLVPALHFKGWLAGEGHNVERVFTFEDFIKGRIRGININTIIIDEAFLVRKDEIAELFYELGLQRGITYKHLITFGTDMS